METVAPFAEIIQEIKESGGDPFRFCYQCGKCDVVCPWNRVTNFSIRKIIRQAAFGLPEIELDDIWRCTTCGMCPTHCPRGVGLVEVSVAIRRIATAYGVFAGEAEALAGPSASLVAEGNPLSGARGDRLAWAKGSPVKPFAEGMEILWFVGCYYSYDPRNMKIAAATARVLNKAGVDFGVLGDKESCCGESIRKAGNEDAFKALARANIKAFIDQGVTRILVSSPHCYHTFVNEYSEFMMKLEVVHITQYLKELIEAGRLELAGSLGKRVAFHDPCYLGRHNGVFDEPREILGNLPGVELVELPDAREKSLCCGGGGGRIWMDTPKGERFGDLRVAQAKEVGAEILATSCPYCISNLEESRLGLPDDDPLVIRDLVEVLEAALDADGGDA